MNILALISQYCLANDLSSGYKRQLISASNALSRAIGKSADVLDLTVDGINLVVSNDKVGKETRANRRRMLLTLAGYAFKSDLIERIDPFLIYRVKLVKKLPNGYSWVQANGIITFLQNTPGPLASWLAKPYKTGNTRREWWLAYLLCCWDTGHPQDLLLLPASALSDDGRICCKRNKTGKVINSVFSAASIKHLGKLRSAKSNLLFPRWCNCKTKKCISQEFKRISQSAGFPGYIKYFRSGAGTAVENKNRQRGHEFLSNSRRVFEQNYLVSKHLDGDNVLAPPPLLIDGING